jgi:hypothetical protein
VEELKPAAAFDFGSQKRNVETEIDIQQYFSAAMEVSAPRLDDQLDIFQRLMNLGDIVVDSAEAWVRVADSHGPASDISLQLAQLCQRALDARKLACNFSDNEKAMLHEALSSVGPPHWHVGGSRHGRVSKSILGILFDKWVEKINHIEATLVRRQQKDTASMRDDTTVASGVSEDTRQFDAMSMSSSVATSCSDCSICGASAKTTKCGFCERAWFCSEECRQNHWNEAGHVPVSSKNSTEILIDVTFDRKNLDLFNAFTPEISFESLSVKDLCTLAHLSLLEYRESLRSGIDGARERAKDTPHAYDVFLVGKGLTKELVICEPGQGADGDMEWRNEMDNRMPLDEYDYQCRVASLSGFSRILESLVVSDHKHLPRLMYQAMKRDELVDVVDPATLSLDTTIVASLNKAQLKVVATVASPSFRSGFLAVQGRKFELI